MAIYNSAMPFGVKNGVPAFQRAINSIVEKENLSQTFPFVDVTICGTNQKDHDDQLNKWLEICRNTILH